MLLSAAAAATPMFANATVNMLFWLAVSLLLFTFGDFLAALTKAKVSSVFVALILFLLGFLSGVFPKDMIAQAGLTQLGTFSGAFLIFHMGTSINLGELVREWKTVLLAVLSMGIACIAIFAASPIIGKEAAIVAIPVINGGIVATKIMVDQAAAGGMAIAAALGTIVYATEKFVGTPPASFCGLKEAESILAEYRANPEAYVAQKMSSAGKETSPNALNVKYKKYFTDFTCLGITAVFAFLSYILQDLTNGTISYSIWALILGATVGHFNFVPKNILTHGKSSGLLSLAVFASIIPSLANIKLEDLSSLAFKVIVIYAVTLVALYVCAYITPMWKLVGSKHLAFGIFMAQFLGFPATFLIANEVASAAAQNDKEKEVVLAKIMPAYVVAGFASVTSISIIVAGIFVKFLG